MISVIILTKNEEKNIIDCIDSINWCDEILIIDDYSSDRTIELIECLKNKQIRVLKHHLDNDFSSQRNFGLQHAKGDWVFFVDADERISLSLQYEILSYLNSNLENYTGYYIKRNDVIWGKELKHGESGAVRLLRLARKGFGEWEGKVHEIWKIKGKIGILKNSIKHFPHPSIAEFLKEINYYTDLKSQELFDKKVKVFWWSIILYPKAKFILNYVIKRGFLDGIEGFIFAILMSFHSFLTRGKLWLLWKNRQKS